MSFLSRISYVAIGYAITAVLVAIQYLIKQHYLNVTHKGGFNEH